MGKTRRVTALLVAILGAGGTLLGQSDEQTEQWEKQDREYLERLERARAEKEAATEEAREDAASLFVARADELVKDRNYRWRETGYHEVRTDDPRVDVDAVAELLRSFETFFEAFWEGKADPVEPTEPSRLYLFYSFFKYNKLVNETERFSEFRPAGEYSPYTDVIVIHTDSVPAEDLPSVIVHEACHQMLSRRLFPEGTRRSLWLEEGLATYFGHTLRKDGDWLPGRIGGQGVAVVKGGRARGSNLARLKLKSLRALMDRDSDWTIDSVVGIETPAAFYGPGAPERYTASWALVHWLLHGEDGAHAEAFVRFLKRDSKGEGGEDAFYEEIGLTAEELDAAWRKHVRSM
jgi:hypothetical protein